VGGKIAGDHTKAISNMISGPFCYYLLLCLACVHCFRGAISLETSNIASGVLSRAKLEIARECGKGNGKSTWSRDFVFTGGMTSVDQLCYLYHFAKAANGSILEQGCFVGRSTSAIALAVKRKTEEMNESKQVLFVTNDIFPASFSAVDRGRYPAHKVPYQWRTSKTDKSALDEFMYGYKELTIPKALYHRYFKNVLDLPGGQLHVLYANLHVNKLLPYVSITAGETYPILPYAFIWSDAAHTPEEIQKNQPNWLKVCGLEYRNVLFAFHDQPSREHARAIDKIFTEEAHVILDRFHDTRAGGFYAIEVECKQSA